MKVCHVYPLRTTSVDGYAWVWCSEDAADHSTRCFADLVECANDARKSGYTVRFELATSERVSKW